MSATRAEKQTSATTFSAEGPLTYRQALKRTYRFRPKPDVAGEGGRKHQASLAKEGH